LALETSSSFIHFGSFWSPEPRLQGASDIPVADRNSGVFYVCVTTILYGITA
jgi:hypothetical protein